MLVALEVTDGPICDSGKGIVRIDKPTMNTIRVKPGDKVSIITTRFTAMRGICMPLHEVYCGRGIIMMDVSIRNNPGNLCVGELVLVVKPKSSNCRYLLISTAREGLLLMAIKIELRGRLVLREFTHKMIVIKLLLAKKGWQG